MKWIAAGIMFMALGNIGLRAQNSQQYRECTEGARGQNELNACASEEAKRVDGELNDVYQKLLLAAAGQPNGVTKIAAVERTWSAYRDAYMEAMYPASNKQAEYGSIYPMEADLLRAKLTRLQIVALNDLVKQYGRSTP